ncbi:hypothetical protein [Streptomyces sp. NPDC000880]
MILTETALPATAHRPAPTLAARVAALLPARNGQPWAVEPYAAWWTTKPAARLTQSGRALVLVEHPWRTDVAWQFPGREPYEPDLRIHRMAPEPIAREILRSMLPDLDDEAAAHATSGPRALGRLETLNEIGSAIRGRGLVTHNHIGLMPNSSVVAWGTPAGVRYAVTLHGTNPKCDVTITGPLVAVQRALPVFLPGAADSTPRYPLRGISGRLARRLAAHLVQFTDVEQLDDGGLAIGIATGPYGYAAPALDPTARVCDTTPVSVDMHGVGVDLLLSLTDQLTR